MGGALTLDGKTLRAVALPTEHGGWSLTLEPVLLGLLVEPGWSGAYIGLAALVAFLVRTPLRIALVDGYRARSLPRTGPARRIAALELTLLAGLVLLAAATAERSFLWPVIAAAPLVLIELWYDVRSRSRRLVPELAGATGVAAVAAIIALAGGGTGRLAVGLWCVAAARAVAAIAFVRVQLRRSKGQAHSVRRSDGFQLLAVTAATIGWLLDAVSAAGVVAISALALVHAVLARRPVPATPILGAQQVVLGLGVVLTAALGALAP